MAREGILPQHALDQHRARTGDRKRAAGGAEFLKDVAVSSGRQLCWRGGPPALIPNIRPGGAHPAPREAGPASAASAASFSICFGVGMRQLAGLSGHSELEHKEENECRVRPSWNPEKISRGKLQPVGQASAARLESKAAPRRSSAYMYPALHGRCGEFSNPRGRGEPSQRELVTGTPRPHFRSTSRVGLTPRQPAKPGKVVSRKGMRPFGNETGRAGCQISSDPIEEVFMSDEPKDTTQNSKLDKSEVTSAGVPWSEVGDLALPHPEWLDGRHEPGWTQCHLSTKSQSPPCFLIFLFCTRTVRVVLKPWPMFMAPGNVLRIADRVPGF
jgi:hypothetical protein